MVTGCFVGGRDTVSEAALCFASPKRRPEMNVGLPCLENIRLGTNLEYCEALQFTVAPALWHGRAV